LDTSATNYIGVAIIMLEWQLHSW